MIISFTGSVPKIWHEHCRGEYHAEAWHLDCNGKNHAVNNRTKRWDKPTLSQENSFIDDEEKEEYFRRGGRYDVKCEECDGRNVIQVVDREATMTEEQKAHLVAYDKHMEEEERYRIEAEGERRWEMGAMGGYSDYY